MPFQNNSNKPKFNLDLNKNKYVPVIASFDSEGNIKPLYFRYTNSDGTSEKVSIDRIEWSEPVRLFGTNYCCIVTINDIQMKVILYYGKEDNRWALRL